MIYYVDGFSSLALSDSDSASGNFTIITNLFSFNLELNFSIRDKYRIRKAVAGETVTVVKNNEFFSLADIENGLVYVENGGHEKLNLKPEVIAAIADASGRNIYEKYIFGYISDFPEEYVNSSVIVDFLDNSFVYKEDLFLVYSVVDKDGIYGVDFLKSGAVKLDFELNEVWYFTSKTRCKMPKLLEPIDDIIIYYHGFEKFEELTPRDLVPGCKDTYYNNSRRLNGELYCLDRANGDKCWERLFPIAPMDMVVHESKVYCVCEYELLRLNIESGEIEQKVNLDVSAQGDSDPGKQLTIIGGKLWIAINHGQNGTHCLLVVDSQTMEIEHRIDIPAPYTVDEFIYFDAEHRKVYYRLSKRLELVAEHHRHLLVIDLDNIDDSVRFEEKPDITAELKVSDRDVGMEELWVEIKNTSLENVLRFGIIETQNQTVNYAWISRYGREGNPEFNGKVHFRCSGIDAPTSEIREQIKLIETSFNQWVQFVSVGSGDLSHRLCSIDVEYIEEGMGSSASAPAELTPDSIADSTSDVTVVNEDYFMVTQDEIKRLAENGFTRAHEAMVKFYAISGVELYIHSDGEGYATVADYRYLLRTMMELCKKDILLQDLKSNQAEAAVNFEFSVNGTQESFEFPKIDTDWLNADFVDSVNDILKKHQSKKYFRFVYVTGIENSDQCFQLCYIDDERYKVLKGCNPPFAA